MCTIARILDLQMCDVLIVYYSDTNHTMYHKINIFPVPSLKSLALILAHRYSQSNFCAAHDFESGMVVLSILNIHIEYPLAIRSLCACTSRFQWCYPYTCTKYPY